MADYEFPPDLLQLKVDFLANERDLPGKAGEEWQAAFKRSQDLALALHRHEWWVEAKPENRHKADMALLEAAKRALSERAAGAEEAG